MGMSVRDKVKESWRSMALESEDADDVEIADEEGRIRHRALNVALLKKY